MESLPPFVLFVYFLVTIAWNANNGMQDVHFSRH
jgi:hypothetical protein